MNLSAWLADHWLPLTMFGAGAALHAAFIGATLIRLLRLRSKEASTHAGWIVTKSLRVPWTAESKARFFGDPPPAPKPGLLVRIWRVFFRAPVIEVCTECRSPVGQAHRETCLLVEWARMRRRAGGITARGPESGRPDGVSSATRGAPAFKVEQPPFQLGQWVRHTAQGWLGRVTGVDSYGRIGVDGGAMQVPCGIPSDFEPAVPREGETWNKRSCRKHPNTMSGDIVFPVDAAQGSDAAMEAACGCLVPRNFGRGEGFAGACPTCGSAKHRHCIGGTR